LSQIPGPEEIKFAAIYGGKNKKFERDAGQMHGEAG